MQDGRPKAQCWHASDFTVCDGIAMAWPAMPFGQQFSGARIIAVALNHRLHDLRFFPFRWPPLSFAGTVSAVVGRVLFAMAKHGFGRCHYVILWFVDAVFR
jgi:hypothetical protein